MPVISVDEVAQLKRALDDDGYVVLRDVVSRDKLTVLATALATEYDEARRSNHMFQGGGSISGHLNCFPGEKARFVYDEIASHGVLDIAQVVNPQVVDQVRATMNYNLPGSTAQFYHMDGLYTGAFLVCNVAVVDTSVENGAIDVLPGTNRRFYPFWRYTVERKYRLTTRIGMNQGDVLLRMSTLWHRGMPNKTAVARPMMSLTFGENGVSDEGDPFLQNDGRTMFYPNWFSTSRIGRLREQTVVRLPWTYSAFRFARSLYGSKGYSTW